MSLLRVFWGFLLLIVHTSAVFAEVPATDQLTGLLDQLQGMQAHFVQTVMDERGQILQKTSGQMVFQRPGRFRWQVDQPSRQLLTADCDKVWFYDIDLRQVVIQKRSAMTVNSPAALLSENPAQLSQHFRVSFFQNTQSFYLSPKEKDAWFHSIVLFFYQNGPYEMRLLDKLGQRTVIHFSQIQLNPTLGPQVFSFTVPKDKRVEIVGD